MTTAPVPSAQTLPDEIRSDLKSVETTTTLTLNLLRTILGLDSEQNKSQACDDEISKKSVTKPKKTATAVTSGAARRPAARKPTFAIHETPAPARPVYHLKERRKCATEVINTSLKALSAAARLKQDRSLAAAQANSQTILRKGSQPLKECSPNGLANPVRGKLSKKDRAGVENVVHCTTIALDCLRQPNENESESPFDLSTENAALVLVDKCIALGLEIHAANQLRKIHEQYWKRRKVDDQATQAGPDSSLSGCLYALEEKDAKLCKFATSFQSQCLRLLITRGSQWIDAKLVEALNPDTFGSPAWTILGGHSLGYLDMDACGSQLRILSLTISKIISSATEAQDSTSPTTEYTLRLCFVTAQIKCLSWKYLHHTPDLQKELWSPLVRSLMRCGTESKRSKDGLLAMHLQGLQKALDGLGMPSNIPAEVSRLTQHTKLLKTKNVTIVDESPSSLIDECRPALLQEIKSAVKTLSKFNGDSKRSVELLKSVSQSLIMQESFKQADLAETLLEGAHLRKQALATITQADASAKSGPDNETHKLLETCTARVIYDWFDFLCRAMKPSASTSLRSIHLSLAKTVEAVTSLEQYTFVKGQDLLQESRTALLRCYELSNSLRALSHDKLEPSVRQYFESLPHRLSQSFWSRYRYLTETRRSISERFDALNDSIQILQEQAPADRRLGTISVKFEELSRLFSENGNQIQARDALKSAIEGQIEQGHLLEAVEASFSTANGQIWSEPNSGLRALGENLSEYVRLGLENGLNWFYDDDHLPLINRAILVEKQVIGVLSSSSYPITSAQIRPSVHAVLAHSIEPKYRNYRLRFISQVLRLLERSKLYSAEEIFDHDQIEKILAAAQGSKAMLHLLGPLLTVLIRTQWAFACGEMHEELLGSLVGGLKSLLDAAEDRDQLRARLYDPKIYASQVQALADFAGILGSAESQCSALEALSRLLALCEPEDRAKRAMCLSQVGMLRTQAGDTTEAGKTIAEAKELLKDVDGGSYVRATLLLDQAEYLLNVGNNPQCSAVLHAANATISDFEQSVLKMSSRTRFQKDSCLSRYALIASRLAFSQGLLLDAFINARQAAKLSTTLWLAIEKTTASHTDGGLKPADHPLQVITEDLSNLSLSSGSSSKQQFQGAVYWSQVSLHCTTLRHMGLMACHAGLYQDALFYHRQASQVARQTAGRIYTMQVESELALIIAASGQSQMAVDGVAKLTVSLPDAAVSVEECGIMLNLSEALWLLGDTDQSQAFVGRTLAFHQKLKRRTNFEEPLLPATVIPRKKKFAKTATAHRPKKQAVRVNAEQEKQKPAIRDSALPLVHRLLIGRLEAMQLRAAPLAEFTTGSSAVLPKADANATVTKALRYLQEATALFSANPANSSLTETALAFPVRYRAPRKSGQLSLLLDQAPHLPLKMMALPKPLEKVPNQQNLAQADNDAGRLLLEAYDALRMLQGARLSELASPMVHLMHKALSQLSLLSTAVAQPLTYSSTPVVLQCLIPKDIARSRERIAIAAETMSELPNSVEPESLEDVGDLVNMLPTTWRVVSIGLSHDQNDLLLSKMSHGVSPFLMRIPLARPGPEDLEAHDFTLDFARLELVDIIKSADANTHDPRGQGDKQTRKAWYAEREALDERLELLLKNIEDIWLGGFKGLLSSHFISNHLLARFGQSLTVALDKHLPSRQRAGKVAGVKVELHARVLELFVTMKLEESAEFEDAITDLLYFVVDMLQFNGEPNAVDEIDFDELLVDVLDALRGYHHAAEAQSNPQTQHTILVLDKELHGFPWESLACLHGQAVYRMPSLGAIKERVDFLRAQSGENQSVKVLATDGAYVLNPSGDLTSTQETFASIFSGQLPHFTSITNRAPTEAEFKTCLTDHPIFLYFGHGSGAQYIRGRTVRALQMQGETCAVSWLMGCSSLKMTECGIYEPYGMPWHYLNGGCHAVVGTLWDVTDREIDRFALRALLEWGLLHEDENTAKPFDRLNKKSKTGTKAQGKGKGNGKVESKEKIKSGEKRGNVAIGEAVAVAREACLLKYLNGAAPVVYGVPVSLE